MMILALGPPVLANIWLVRNSQLAHQAGLYAIAVVFLGFFAAAVILMFGFR